MRLFGDINQQGLAMMGGVAIAESDTPAIGTRVFDLDGDDRNDLVLVDLNNDGRIDGVVRALDTDGDGRNDLYIQYNKDLSIGSIGRVSATTGQFEVIYEQPDLIDQILAFLGLKDLDSPADALFTTFDDPYIFDTFGTYGVEATDTNYESVTVDPTNITEVAGGEAPAMEGGATLLDDTGADMGEAAPSTPPDTFAADTGAESAPTFDATSSFSASDPGAGDPYEAGSSVDASSSFDAGADQGSSSDASADMSSSYDAGSPDRGSVEPSTYDGGSSDDASVSTSAYDDDSNKPVRPL